MRFDLAHQMHMDVNSPAFEAILVHVECNDDWDPNCGIQMALKAAGEKRYRLDKKATFETVSVSHKESEALEQTGEQAMKAPAKGIEAMVCKIEIKEYVLLKEDVKVLKCGDGQASKLVGELRQFAATFAHSSNQECPVLSCCHQTCFVFA